MTQTAGEADFTLDLVLGRKSVVADDTGDLFIEGYASDWATDRDDEAFAPGAFEASLASYLKGNPVLLFNHDIGKPLGQVVEAKIDRLRGLWVKARIDRAAPGSWAASVAELVRRGTLRAFSVGGRFYREGRRIVRADLREVSIVSVPANARALFTLSAPTTAYAAAIKAFDPYAPTPEQAIRLREASARLALVEADLAIANAELRARGR